MTLEGNRSDSDLLEEVNSKITSSMTPVTVYLSVLMFFGLLGNILVCYYYGCKTGRSSHAVFICTVAVFDLISCGVSIPIEIVDITFFYTFRNGGLCKFLRFINYIVTTGSAFTLLVISVDRFRRVCRPFKKQLNLKKSKIMCGISVVVALVYSWPALVFYTSVNVNLTASNGKNITGFDCTTTKDSDYVTYFWIFNGVYLVTFLVSTTILCVMYSFVGRSILGHKRNSQLYSRPISKVRGLNYTDSDTTQTKKGNQKTHGRIEELVPPENSNIDQANNPGDAIKNVEFNRDLNEQQSGDSNTRRRKSLEIKSTKYTMIMIVITAIFIISFLPHLVLIILDEFLTFHKTTGSQVAFQFGVRSYFLNSAINPLVYGFFNPKFRLFYSSKLCRCFQYQMPAGGISTSSGAT
ncbi:hypothetical protein DPMN_152204 [Dreissena polymorpha]|uniref:G-protein coupled receptors family 1 profile domain-containing protein n=2 Tax=Dreissena polymorpha TaxID=45954 RepID=A0A9D4J763_DREPO|nr:hypothetical protein DPMN_152204 [Dreissena polymorpha]